MTTRAVLAVIVSLVSAWGFTTSAPDYSIVGVPQSQVDITDSFWAPKIASWVWLPVPSPIFRASTTFNPSRRAEAAVSRA